MLWLLDLVASIKTKEESLSWKDGHLQPNLVCVSYVHLPCCCCCCSLSALLLLCHHSLPSLWPPMTGCLPRGKLTFVTLAPLPGIRPPAQSRPACKASELRALTFPYILDLPACHRVVFLNLLWFGYRCCPDITIRNNVVGVRNQCGGRILLDRCKLDDGRARWVLLTNDFLFTLEKVMPVQ